MRRPDKPSAGYIAALTAVFLLAVAWGWTAPGTQIDNYAYDFMFRLTASPPPTMDSVVLAFDDRTLRETGGMSQLRSVLAEVLDLVSRQKPKAVAVDIILADAGADQAAREADRRLAAAFRSVRHLVLPCDIVPGGWQDPAPVFRGTAEALGHVHGGADKLDSVTRQIPLQAVANGRRRWALSLEAFRLSHPAGPLIESPEDIELGGVRIPASGPDRQMRVRYVPPDAEGRSRISTVSVKDVLDKPETARLFRDKVVFIGVTSQSAARDRPLIPTSYGQATPGVEVHAHAYETLAGQQFFTTAGQLPVLGFCALLVALAGLIFWYRDGWGAYSLGGLLVASVMVLPFVLFSRNVVFPVFGPTTSAWLSVGVAASYQHFVIRRRLRQTEAERFRYQQAIRFVTHEMKTPLTAIQGSSELIGRYNFSDEKRKQIAEVINSESKRLSGMIQTFLNVERLSEGEMQLKKETFELRRLLEPSLARVAPLAERKQIAIVSGRTDNALLNGDRELMEYAVYNLLTNAIKYSPAATQVSVTAVQDGGTIRIRVQDQGIGMDESDLRNIFRKFYRTKRAEASGEAGTGIGLSIVEQIVVSHGGSIEVTSSPGKGSCFTLVVPATALPGGDSADSSVQERQIK